MSGDKSECFVVQYRPNTHEQWKDDSLRSTDAPTASARLERCRTAKIFKGAEWRIVKRIDTEI